MVTTEPIACSSSNNAARFASSATAKWFPSRSSISARRSITAARRDCSAWRFHPDFAKNGLFYVDFTADRPKLLTVIAEFHVDPKSDEVDPKSERVLLTIDQPFSNHNGGGIVFGRTRCSISPWATRKA